MAIKWTDIEIKALIENYPKKFEGKGPELRKRLETAIPTRSYWGIKGMAKVIGITTSGKYDLNHNYFSTPTPESAYWAGFIASDGCIADHTPEIIIDLSSRDTNHLEKLKNALSFSGPVCIYSNRKHPAAKLQLTSRQIIEDLETIYNITPRKSLTLMPPNIQDNTLIQAFIVGYIDGDGSIGYQDLGVLHSIRLIGTYHFLSWVKKIIEPHLPKDNYGPYANINRHGKGRAFIYGVRGHRGEAVIKWLREVSVSRLDRKWG